MKAIRMIECLALCTAALFLAGGCSESPSGEDRGPRVKVGFAAPDIEPAEGVSAADAPGSKAALAEKTTVRVLVYVPGSANPSAANYIAEQTYYINGGKLVPCTVNADGSFKAANPDGELSLPATRYDFYAVTPALPVGADHITIANVPNGADFAKSATNNVAVDRDRTVTLTQLVRQCAKIDLVVQNASDNTSLTALNITSGGNGVVLSNLAAAQNADLKTGTVFTQASGTTSLSVTPASFTQVNATKATASVALLPRLGSSRLGFSFDLTYTISGTTTRSTFTGSVGNLALERGKSYTVTLTMKKSGATLTFTDWDEQTVEMPLGVANSGYPYISAGTYVVCKDDRGQATFPLHENWTAANPMPAHTEADPADTFSARFEVLNVDGGYSVQVQGMGFYTKTWDDAVEDCRKLGNGWRLPTRTELLFIYRYCFYFTSFTNSPPLEYNQPYWTGTSITPGYIFDGRPVSGNYAWAIIGVNNVWNNIVQAEYIPVDKSDNIFFRCVRDIE